MITANIKLFDFRKCNIWSWISKFKHIFIKMFANFVQFRKKSQASC